MGKIYLKQEVINYLRMLEFERTGYEVLLKEFMEQSNEENLNINNENFSILMDNYKAAFMKSHAAVEEIVGFPVTSYYIDFYKRELKYDK